MGRTNRAGSTGQTQRIESATRKKDAPDLSRATSVDDRIETQRAEFNAVSVLSEQYRRITMTPVVDDDYPEVRYDYERAVCQLIEALKRNKRI